ncbi:hypothetical protein HKX48_007113 [Thoreauomyces humboldtii]|nr:hypothetical protein HKX48_007113 [Thoreauomyces humboldtii]
MGRKASRVKGRPITSGKIIPAVVQKPLPKKKPIVVDAPLFTPLELPISQSAFTIYLEVQQFLLRFATALGVPNASVTPLSEEEWPPNTVTDFAYALYDFLVTHKHFPKSHAVEHGRRTVRWTIIADLLDPERYLEADPGLDWPMAFTELRTLRTTNSLDRVPFFAQLACIHNLVRLVQDLCPTAVHDILDADLKERRVLSRELDTVGEKLDRLKTLRASAGERALGDPGRKGSRRTASARNDDNDPPPADTPEAERLRILIGEKLEHAKALMFNLARVEPQVAPLGMDRWVKPNVI